MDPKQLDSYKQRITAEKYHDPIDEKDTLKQLQEIKGAHFEFHEGSCNCPDTAVTNRRVKLCVNENCTPFELTVMLPYQKNNVMEIIRQRTLATNTVDTCDNELAHLHNSLSSAHSSSPPSDATSSLDNVNACSHSSPSSSSSVHSPLLNTLLSSQSSSSSPPFDVTSTVDVDTKESAFGFCCYLDATGQVNEFGLMLITLMGVIPGSNRGFPIAHKITSSKKPIVTTEFLSFIRKQIPEMRIQTIVIDKDDAELKGIKDYAETSGEKITVVLCFFHTMQAIDRYDSHVHNICIPYMYFHIF